MQWHMQIVHQNMMIFIEGHKRIIIARSALKSVCLILVPSYYKARLDIIKTNIFSG